MPATTHFEYRLERIERLARGSVLSRFLNHPLRYVAAIGYWRIIYPLAKKGRFARAKTFFGAEMEVVLPSATEIFLFGAKTHDSEIRLARFLMRTLKAGDTFCDVGAHFGYFTLLASALVGEKGKVVSLEASRSTYGILEKNTAGATNVAIFHKAASDVGKTLVFNEFPALFSEYNSLVLPAKQNAAWLKNNPPAQIEVQGVRLDDFLSTYHFFPNLFKIDVEGAEPQVLLGLAGYLTEHSPTLVMEYLISSGQNEAHREAVAFAHELGYQLYRIKNDGGIEDCADVEAAMKKDGLDSDNIILRK
ncbi:MAG: FkbM family methyltransferase [Saprospiraceae bacterium]